PQRIATDTSQKLSVRFGETVKKYIGEGRDLSELRVIPLVFAGWLRYLMGVGDDGEAFELSPDPLMDQVRSCVEGIALGGKADRERLMPLLKNEKIFGSDLEKIGMADRVLDLFDRLIAGKGAVRATMKEVLK
ncbi:MAG: mannitol dehydrogenase family protein, partial [Clostridia bacterium]|nr:mannitol dehydrogenase family protein [Clostridia bacterium]